MLFTILYQFPLFLLIAWWFFCRRAENSRVRLAPAAFDVLVLIIALARFRGSSIPPSGHALILTHSFITVRNGYFRVVALVMLAITVALKVSWGDYRSWLFGIVFGLVSGTAWKLLSTSSRRVGPPEEEKPRA